MAIYQITDVHHHDAFQADKLNGTIIATNNKQSLLKAYRPEGFVGVVKAEILNCPSGYFSAGDTTVFFAIKVKRLFK